MAGGSLNPTYAPIYVAVGNKYGIPPAVLAGIADVETNGGANVSTSSAGAQGLMQFEPGTAASMGVNVNSPASEIDGAARLLLSYGYRANPLRAIGAYNGGPGNPQYGYANQVMAEARRLGPQLRGVKPSLAGVGAATGSSDPTSQSLMAASSSSDLFGSHSSQLLYATVWIGALLTGVWLFGSGLNTTTHGAPVRAIKTAGRAAALAAK